MSWGFQLAADKPCLLCDARRFDGPGMLHAVRIKDGKASFSNTYVQTSRLKQERRAGHPLFMTVIFPLGAARLHGIVWHYLQSSSWEVLKAGCDRSF